MRKNVLIQFEILLGDYNSAAGGKWEQNIVLVMRIFCDVDIFSMMPWSVVGFFSF